MYITTSYTVPIKYQLKQTDSGIIEASVDDRLMRQTSLCCLNALKFCVNAFLKEWDYLSTVPVSPKPGILNRNRYGDILMHSTKDNIAKYADFDTLFPGMPAYMRRSIVADALGSVSSYISNHKNWEAEDPRTRGKEPSLGLPERYELTFYDQERDLCNIDKGIIGLKFFNGKVWEWYFFRISASDAKYISALKSTRKMLSPIVEKVRGRYRIRFSFKEEKELVQNDNPLAYTVLGVDLGINAPASWSVVTKDGTVHAKGVIHLKSEEDRLNHLINRKRMYQQAGKKSHSIYRLITSANRQLSIDTAKEVIKIAVLYNVDCIVFEYLDKASSAKGKKFRERIHMWRTNDVQSRVELQAHRNGMRISRICAWGTSRLAFDGSGVVKRGKEADLPSYSLCRFQTGKIYNCDLSAAQNIAARFFLREYAKNPNCPDLPKTPQRTLATLVELKKRLAA